MSTTDQHRVRQVSATPPSTTEPTRPTESTQAAPQTFRSTARVIGVLYLAGMVVGIGGNILIQSVLMSDDQLTAVALNSSLLALGVVLWLFTVAGDVAHGVLMFPVLRQRSERLAVGYLAARIADGIFIAVMSLLIAVQIPIGLEFISARDSGVGDASYLQSLSRVLEQGNLYAYEIGMMTVGVAGLILCSALLRANLVPRAIAVWGLAGYAILLAGSTLQILGFQLNSLQAIPGGLWEVFIGVWFILKGFRTPNPRREVGSPTL